MCYYLTTNELIQDRMNTLFNIFKIIFKNNLLSLAQFAVAKRRNVSIKVLRKVFIFSETKVNNFIITSKKISHLTNLIQDRLWPVSRWELVVTSNENHRTNILFCIIKILRSCSNIKWKSPNNPHLNIIKLLF